MIDLPFPTKAEKGYRPSPVQHTLGRTARGRIASIMNIKGTGQQGKLQPRGQMAWMQRNIAPEPSQAAAGTESLKQNNERYLKA